MSASCPAEGSAACVQVYPVPQGQVTLTDLTVSPDQTVASFVMVVPAQSNTRNATFGHAQVSAEAVWCRAICCSPDVTERPELGQGCCIFIVAVSVTAVSDRLMCLCVSLPWVTRAARQC